MYWGNEADESTCCIALPIIIIIIIIIIVEGTTYNHGRPEGISERLAFYEPVSRYATGMSALRTHIHGIIPRGSSLPTSPDPAP